MAQGEARNDEPDTWVTVCTEDTGSNLGPNVRAGAH